MLLGKRPRPNMKRTTSMNAITFDLDGSEEPQPSDPQLNPKKQVAGLVAPQNPSSGGYDGLDQRFLMATISPRNHRRDSADFGETAHFLRSCFLCKRRLVPGRDIYMYRGDSAFCSHECRQQQMIQDERKEKCALALKKAPPSTTVVSKVCTKGETVAV